MAEPHCVPVVGMSFVPGYPDFVHTLRELVDGLTWQDEPIPVVFVRNPDNEHDANAVQVHVPALGIMIGHVSRQIAARLAPSLDEGVVFAASVDRVRVDPDHPENPGVDIKFQREEQETSI